MLMGGALCVRVRRVLRGSEILLLLKGLLPLVLCFLRLLSLHSFSYLGTLHTYFFISLLCPKSSTRLIPT